RRIWTVDRPGDRVVSASPWLRTPLGREIPRRNLRASRRWTRRTDTARRISTTGGACHWRRRRLSARQPASNALVAAAFALTMSSAFGQTYFIAIFAPWLKAEL